MKAKAACLLLLFLCITLFEIMPFAACAQDGSEGRRGRRMRGDAVQRPSPVVTAPGQDGGDEINPAQTSDDPTYGYTKENPVKLGGESERTSYSNVFLKQLRDKNRKPFKYYRIGNVGAGPDRHITDLYKLTDSEGKEYNIFIDMYHPDKNPLECKAPKGMFIVQ
jgi:hypothetical protein